MLGGTVAVHDAVWRRRFEIDPNIFDLAGGAAVGLGPGGGPGPAAAVRHPGHRQQHAADPEQPRGRCRERGSAAAGHLRSAGALRPRRGRPRQHPVRGQPLRRHARHDRFLTPPPAHRAAVRYRGGDARPRGVAERYRSVPRHARRDGNADAASRCRSTPIRRSRGRHLPLLLGQADRRLQRGLARAQRERRRGGRAGAAARPLGRGCSRARSRRRSAASSRRRSARHRADRAVDRQRQRSAVDRRPG